MTGYGPVSLRPVTCYHCGTVNVSSAQKQTRCKGCKRVFKFDGICEGVGVTLKHWVAHHPWAVQQIVNIALETAWPHRDDVLLALHDRNHMPIKRTRTDLPVPCKETRTWQNRITYILNRRPEFEARNNSWRNKVFFGEIEVPEVPGVPV